MYVTARMRMSEDISFLWISPILDKTLEVAKEYVDKCIDKETTGMVPFSEMFTEPDGYYRVVVEDEPYAIYMKRGKCKASGQMITYSIRKVEVPNA